MLTTARSIWDWLHDRDRFGRSWSWPKVYLIVAIFTFGYDAALYPSPADWASQDGVPTVVNALGAALIWPFFWSWEVFSWIV